MKMVYLFFKKKETENLLGVKKSDVPGGSGMPQTPALRIIITLWEPHTVHAIANTTTTPHCFLILSPL